MTFRIPLNLYCIFSLTVLLLFTGCDSKKSQQSLISKIPDPKTLNESYVSNPDLILSAETVASLNEQLSALDQSGTAHIDVVFVKSIGDLIPKDIAHELFNTWKIGSKETDNGLLIFVVEDQHRIEFETGYGLEGILPDMICQRIQQEHMIPYAKQGDYNKAITEGVTAVITRLKGENTSANENPAPPVAVDTVLADAIKADPVTIVPDIVVGNPTQQFANTNIPQSKPMGPVGNLFTLGIAFLFVSIAKLIGHRLHPSPGKPSFLNPVTLLLCTIPIALVVLLNLYYPISWINVRAIIVLYLCLVAYIHLHFFFKSRSLKAKLAGKSRHEQFIAWRDTYEPLRGTSKLIPGLSSYWKKYTEQQYSLRNAVEDCPKCGKPMVRLNEENDDKYLLKGQVSEEKIDAVDYDVWRCDPCQNTLTMDYQNLKSSATTCKKCGFKTMQYTRSRIIEAATTSSAGCGCAYYTCYNCKFSETEEYTIARIASSSSSSGSSSSSSSSSSRSSSSSSRSSSSGGSSGGGGSGSSW
ncbi:TPM domain-containing protein [Pedobacter sp. MC2016-24]|uniref:TPM domain-containing protein n=1 Tax=Pedobacter sp. MC2016-24 TaxID=2780090 RepID=UPI001880A733|nr:TPM domain-containing protein [Pedobacter sp. MC2016-24]MBE9600535.1 TPM domain-containing protein [Pedobacter sp. MC2016-24]